MSADIEFEQALKLSRFSYDMELAKRQKAVREDDLELALAASMQSFKEEMEIRRLMPDDTDLELALIISREDMQKPSQNRNNCLDVAFKQLYQAHFGQEFVRNVREEIRRIAEYRFGRIDAATYEVDDGQQLSVHAFEALLHNYNMRVLYVRKNHERRFLGRGRIVEGYAILHTVGEDYGVNGEYKYAGHYQVISNDALNNI